MDYILDIMNTLLIYCYLFLIYCLFFLYLYTFYSYLMPLLWRLPIFYDSEYYFYYACTLLYIRLYSVGVQFLFCLNILLKVAKLPKPAFIATCIIDRSVSINIFSACMILRFIR